MFDVHFCLMYVCISVTDEVRNFHIQLSAQYYFLFIVSVCGQIGTISQMLSTLGLRFAHTYIVTYGTFTFILIFSLENRLGQLHRENTRYLYYLRVHVHVTMYKIHVHVYDCATWVCTMYKHVFVSVRYLCDSITSDTGE